VVHYVRTMYRPSSDQDGASNPRVLGMLQVGHTVYSIAIAMEAAMDGVPKQLKTKAQNNFQSLGPFWRAVPP
jgi:hypothetical protein